MKDNEFVSTIARIINTKRHAITFCDSEDINRMIVSTAVT